MERGPSNHLNQPKYQAHALTTANTKCNVSGIHMGQSFKIEKATPTELAHALVISHTPLSSSDNGWNLGVANFRRYVV